MAHVEAISIMACGTIVEAPAAGAARRRATAAARWHAANAVAAHLASARCAPVYDLRLPWQPGASERA